MANEEANEGLNNVTKAAVVLMSLGKEKAADVMKFLTESEVKKLSRAFMTVQEVNRELQLKVASEFRGMLNAADKMVVDGREFAKDVIGKAFADQSTSGTLVDYIMGSKKEPLTNLMNDVPQQIIDNFVQSEHPQTMAFLLTKMTPDMASGMLSKMTEEMQTDVMVRVAQLENVKSDVIDEVREVLRSQLRGVSMGGDEELGGPKAAADILNFVERSNEERILSEIEEMHPEMAEKIRNLMFTFEDVGKIDDRSIQTILKEVPREMLVVALKRASEDLKNLLFRNISQRAADMLRDDLDALGPTKLKDVEKAQQSIVDIVRRLEAEGKIQVASGSGAEELI